MKLKLLSAIALTALLFAGCAESTGVTKTTGKKMMKSRYQSVKMDQAQLLMDGKERTSCTVCGMKLPMFYRTSHASKVDGHQEQFCSIHCLVATQNSGKRVTDMQVVDNETLKFISVADAWYVVKSSKPATMSKVSKYAFKNRAKAEAFAKEFGGEVMNFEGALAVAKEDFKN
jgi:nitrous oxide reductase accessory protein NosL